MENQSQPNQQNTNSLPPQNTAHETEPEKALIGADKFKRSFFQILIGCIVSATVIAVIAVLIGGFNDTLNKSLGTIAMVALHAILSFSYITEAQKRDKQDGARTIELFSNTVFALIVASFITSVFAIWQLLEGSLTQKLYMSYAVLLFSTMQADVLYRIRGFEKKIDITVTANYFFIVIVATMLFIVIFSDNPSLLGEFYYRLLAASGIIDAALIITAIIMHKMYLQKHPVAAAAAQTVTAQSENFWKNPLVILLIMVTGGFVLLFIVIRIANIIVMR